MKFAMISMAALSVSLTGCGTLLHDLTGGESDKSVSAPPILTDKDPLTTEWNAAPGYGTDAAGRLKKLEFLGKVIQESRKNCDEFLAGLTVGENSVNTTSDIITTVSSALATAVTPPGTKSAFSAAATIASGSKTAIDADIYAKAGAADFATAIQKSYSTYFQSYTDGLTKLATSADPIIVNNEVAKIEAIHSQCALGPAESTIQAKLGETQQQNPPPAGTDNTTKGKSSELSPLLTRAPIVGDSY